MEQSIRLFTAIDLPLEQKKTLHSLAQKLSGVRVTPEEQLHLTLNFIGDVDATLLHKLRTECLAITLPSFSLRLEGMGTFPPRGTPRILWIGLSPCPPLMQLQQALRKKITETGIFQEKRAFQPHITLARIKKSSRKELFSFLEDHALISFPPFTVTSFHLYSSKLSHTGATHHLVQSFRLQNSTAE